MNYVKNKVIDSKPSDQDIECKMFVKGENDQAKDHVKNLIKEFAPQKLYIIDPYFSKDGVCNIMDEKERNEIELKCLCDSEKGSSEGFEDQIQKIEIRKTKEPLLHDRFLIFPPIDNQSRPIVYSLGTSLNGLGKKHHLVQRVAYPELIFNEFERLWNNKDIGNDFKDTQ